MYPTARRNGLVTHQAGSDLIVFDETNHSIHHLNPLAAEVWRLADGVTSGADMATVVRAQVDPSASAATVDLALSELATAGLLEGEAPPRRTQSRRALLRRGAMAGAMIPVVVSVTAPAAAQASSVTCGQGSYATSSDCEAAIPEREAAIPPECTTVNPYHCIWIRLTGCWSITGTFSCPPGV